MSDRFDETAPPARQPVDTHFTSSIQYEGLVMANNSLTILESAQNAASTHTMGLGVMNYRPTPIDTSQQVLPSAIEKLVERLAEHTHDLWARQRLADGWKFGPNRNDTLKEHPCLVPYAELPEEEKRYDRQISTELARAILSLGFTIESMQLAVVTVNWLQRAKTRIRNQGLLEQWERELKTVFCQSEEDVELTVSDVFRGFSNDERKKIVLGVQAKTKRSVASHVIKLGVASEVAQDAEGWRTCILRHAVTSRALTAVWGMTLPAASSLDDENGEQVARYAAVYQDAYQLFGADVDTEGPKSLETAADWAIHDSKPDCLSVERVIKQLYGELNRCLYQDACEATALAREFYRRELHKGEESSAWRRWSESPFHQQLRRDTIWRLTGRERPDAKQLPGYLDPWDYLHWAIANFQVPSTLVGRSHGDLHCRNILVGVVRGEVEQPVVVDYGDMKLDGLPIWDFVKLEVELKTRLLPKLFGDQRARDCLAQRATGRAASSVNHRAEDSLPDGTLGETAMRAKRVEFAFHFETLLAELTSHIVSQNLSDTALKLPDRTITGHASLDKALCVLYRLRQEAAYHLGYSIGRSRQWRDEFYFALAVYSLLKSKWEIEEPQLEWSLVSAGVAVSKLTDVATIEKLLQTPPPDDYPTEQLPSHLIPLAWAHSHWSKHQSDQGCGLLVQAMNRFPCAVTLQTEYALCLSASGQINRAIAQIEPLRSLCRDFRDHETLSRLARTYKDLGDTRLASEKPRIPYEYFAQERLHPAWQLYRDSMRLYYDAFEFSHNYYPGINAATMALLTGATQELQQLLAELTRIFLNSEIPPLVERHWWFASQGEAALLARDQAKAVQLYRAALDSPGADQPGTIQPIYNQLCRLGWALGDAYVHPVLKELKHRDRLRSLIPSSFGDCGVEIS